MGRTIVPFRHSVKPVPECFMPSVLKRTSARLLAFAPNYLEATAVMVLAVVSPLLFRPGFWSFNPKMCVSIALFAVIFIHACLDKGRILTYLGWVKPRREVYWMYAVMGGAIGACAVLFLCAAHIFLWARRRRRNCWTIGVFKFGQRMDKVGSRLGTDDELSC
jgi:hypothetical protein